MPLSIALIVTPSARLDASAVLAAKAPRAVSTAAHITCLLFIRPLFAVEYAPRRMARRSRGTRRPTGPPTGQATSYPVGPRAAPPDASRPPLRRGRERNAHVRPLRARAPSRARFARARSALPEVVAPAEPAAQARRRRRCVTLPPRSRRAARHLRRAGSWP